MRYILDTDLFTLSEIPDSPEYLRLRARVAQLPEEDEVATTIITYEEQTRGWLAYAAKARTSEHQVKAYAHLKQHLLAYLRIEVWDYDVRAAQEFERLRGMKLGVGTLDLKIAAIVVARNAVLLSRNLRDFRRVPGLSVEDWTRA
jgi:tRNA(fMet)-specific endonuclease VapC